MLPVGLQAGDAVLQLRLDTVVPFYLFRLCVQPADTAELPADVYISVAGVIT